MKIETKIPCPDCGAIIDVEKIKELIINRIRIFVDAEL